MEVEVDAHRDQQRERDQRADEHVPPTYKCGHADRAHERDADDYDNAEARVDAPRRRDVLDELRRAGTRTPAMPTFGGADQ